MSLTTNSHGFRGPEIDDLSDESILFLGDSFTMGYGVSDGEEYPALIRQQLREQGDTATVINAGMGGNGNGWWLNWLKQHADTLNPRHVVLQFYINDLDDNIGEGFYTLDENQQLIQLPIQAPSKQRKLQHLIESVPGLANSYMVGFARQVVHAMGARAANKEADNTNKAEPVQQVSDAELRAPARKLQVEIVRGVMDILQEKGWPVSVLLVDLYPDNVESLQAHFHSYGIEPIVITGKIQYPEMYFKVDHHWNSKGHRYAASLLEPMLLAPVNTN